MNTIRLWKSWHEMVFSYLYMYCKILQKNSCSFFVNCVLCCLACLLLNPCISRFSDVFSMTFSSHVLQHFSLRSEQRTLQGHPYVCGWQQLRKGGDFEARKAIDCAAVFFNVLFVLYSLFFIYCIFFFKHCADIGVNDLSIPAQSRKIDQRLDFVAWYSVCVDDDLRRWRWNWYMDALGKWMS